MGRRRDAQAGHEVPCPLRGGRLRRLAPDANQAHLVLLALIDGLVHVHGRRTAGLPALTAALP